MIRADRIDRLDSNIAGGKFLRNSPKGQLNELSGTDSGREEEEEVDEERGEVRLIDIEYDIAMTLAVRLMKAS